MSFVNLSVSGWGHAHDAPLCVSILDRLQFLAAPPVSFQEILTDVQMQVLAAFERFRAVFRQEEDGPGAGGDGPLPAACLH